MKSITDNEPLIIKTIQGIDKDDFSDFNNLGLEVKIHEREPQALASISEELIDYIVISSLAFPFDFVKTLVQDSTKQGFIAIIQKVKALWYNQKDCKVCTLKSGEEPEFKKPKIVISFPIDNDEYSILEIYDNISDELTEKITTQYFDLLKLKVENRLKENTESKKLKLPIQTVSRKELRKPWQK